MVRSSRRLALSLVLAVGITAPALAQVHDGADNSPAEQDIADQLRAKGSDCTAPACRNNAEGIYPQTDRAWRRREDAVDFKWAHSKLRAGHEPSVQEARNHAKTHDVDDRVTFIATSAKDIKEAGFDLVTSFDCLHDMGDPRGCASHVRQILKSDGTWMVVEPIAGDSPDDNMNPVGRLYYNASTMICLPTSLDQEVAEGLGAQAGEAKLTEVIRAGGFTHVRRATAGPFNMVLEACVS